MKNIKKILSLSLILFLLTITVYGSEFIDNVKVVGYEKNVDYMSEIEKCISHNTEYSIKIGKIYEEQRNLKIEKESLKTKKSNIFNSNNIDEIQKNYNEYNNINVKKEVQNNNQSVASRGNYERTLYMELPNIDTSFKTYMSYKAITNQNSLQWKYRQLAYTDTSGFRRINDDYVVALGTYYAKNCGERFRITLNSGKVFTAITGDIKDDRHTDSTHRYIPKNGNVIEFLVDINLIDNMSRKMGDMSYSGFEGKIISIEKI